jgi:tRNA threonylcarbamoyladenosine biosynthesis protein TsaB
MKILALEFSTDVRSVAVVETVQGTKPKVRSTCQQAEGRETRAISLMEQALSEAAIDRTEIDHLAIGLGPGSYTGVRLALALAQGWNLGQPVTLLGVTSMSVLAAEAHAAGWGGLVHLVIDAHRDEFYSASYDLSHPTPICHLPLRIVSRQETDLLAKEPVVLAGPEIQRWWPQGRLLIPTAGTLGLLAARQQDVITGPQLEPVYLRTTTFVKAPPPRFTP